MPDKEKKSEFVVNDRRLFSSDGELRKDVAEAEERQFEREQAAAEAQRRVNDERAAQQKAVTAPAAELEPQHDPEAPTAAEQKASADAYAESTKQVDARIRKELSRQGRADQARDLEMSFDKFVASLYMTKHTFLGKLIGIDAIKAQLAISVASLDHDRDVVLRTKRRNEFA